MNPIHKNCTSTIIDINKKDKQNIEYTYTAKSFKITFTPSGLTCLSHAEIKEDWSRSILCWMC